MFFGIYAVMGQRMIIAVCSRFQRAYKSLSRRAGPAFSLCSWPRSRGTGHRPAQATSALEQDMALVDYYPVEIVTQLLKDVDERG